MLELQGLTKRYAGITAVADLNLTLDAGAVTGCLGPNGSGKSTTVKMLIGLIEPTQGHVLWQGQDIRDHLVSYRRFVGYVPEEPHVYTHLSALEYLSLVGRLRGLSDVLIAERSGHLLRLFGLQADGIPYFPDSRKGCAKRC